MEKKQIKRLEMMETTNSFLDTNTAVWSPIPIVATYKNQLAQAIDELKQAAQDQEAAQVFISRSLKELKLRISEKMDILDDILEAYAEDQEDVELMSAAANSKSDSYRLSNEDFETKVKNVIDQLEGHVTNMKDYGLTKSQIHDVQLSFGAYQDRRGIPRSYKVASRQATESILALMEEGTTAISRLDKVMKRFRRSNPSFYTGYTASRTVVG